jgi:hypothetical protein
MRAVPTTTMMAPTSTAVERSVEPLSLLCAN